MAHRLTLPLAGALLVLGTCAPAASALDARPAASFADAVGVNVHMSYLDTPYADAGRVRDALLDLGVRHVRDTVCGPCSWERDAQATLGSAGVRLTAVVGGRGADGLAEADADLDDIAARRSAYTEALESVNEPDNSATGTDWVAETRAVTAEIARRAQADPLLRGRPVLAPVLVSDAGRAALGDLSPWVDFANAHPYRVAGTPEGGLDAEDAAAHRVAPGRPIVVTETGYRSEGDPASWNQPVSEATVARYLPRVLLEGFRRGWARTFDYELIDTFAPGTTGPAADQTGYGLLRYDGTPRPAYAALRSLMRIVGDPAAASAGAAAPLDVDLDGPADLRHVLLQRADGSYVLALWRPVSVWDATTRSAAPDAPAPVTVGLPAPMAVRLHRLTPETTQALGTTSRVVVPASGDVTLLELTPATATAAAAAPASPSEPTASAAPQAATQAAPIAPTPAATPPTAPAPAVTRSVKAATPLAPRAVQRAGALHLAPAPGTARIARISYAIDGRTVARRTGAPWGARIALRRLAPGRHRLSALVRLRSGALLRTATATVVVRAKA